ncbi:MAG: alkaline phosphatase family protein [Erysipelotrichales bacterium]|nr:alkaline phosphatase family protein [Erysipelotrichales bacterium]
MSKNKLLVFCLDALCTMDIEFMKTLPAFAEIINRGSYVKHIEPIYPSLTYPCHVSIITGNYADKHGIIHNEIVTPGKLNSPWYNQRSDVHSKTLLDYGKENGYTTCSISWPVSGGADYDFNMPMIVPYGYIGPDPGQFFVNNATQNLLDTYYWKYGRYLMGKDRSLDLYTMALAPDIIRDFGQPDIMLIKMCDLDSARHAYGVDNENVREQLRKHNYELAVILDTVKRYGDYDNTNFVILGDHGQSDVDHVLHFNVALKEAGFIRVNENNELVDYDAYCHSAALSAWIELKNPEDEEMRKKVYDFLMECKNERDYGLGYVFTKEEVKEKYHLEGPFDFVIEGEKAISFGNRLDCDIFGKTEIGDYKTSKASHGGLPFKDETTTFIACGPSVKQGVVVERCSMVNEAPTMAKMLGFEMPDVDGVVIEEILK